MAKTHRWGRSWLCSLSTILLSGITCAQSDTAVLVSNMPGRIEQGVFLDLGVAVLLNNSANVEFFNDAANYSRAPMYRPVDFGVNFPRLAFEVQRGRRNSHLVSAALRIPVKSVGNRGSYSEVSAEDFIFTYQYGFDITGRGRARSGALQICIGAAYWRRSVNNYAADLGQDDYYMHSTMDSRMFALLVTPRFSLHVGDTNISYGLDIIPFAWTESQCVRTTEVSHLNQPSDFTFQENHGARFWSPVDLINEHALLAGFYFSIGLKVDDWW